MTRTQNSFSLLATIGLVAALITPPLGFCQDNGTQEKTATDVGSSTTHSDSPDNLIVGEGVTYRNLTIFPVSSKLLHDEDLFITLDEGLKSKTIEVLEGKAINNSNPDTSQTDQQVHDSIPQAQANDSDIESNAQANRQQLQTDDANLAQQIIGNTSASNSVNRLYVVNRSGKPLYLMAGEIVFGGDQDRIIAEETIIPPTEKPVPIAVFCVEQGRWGQRSVEQTVDALESANPDDNINQAELNEQAKAANDGKFVATVGNATNPVRKAALLSKQQGEVWDNVGKENTKAGIKSESSNFASNYSDKSNLQRIEKPHTNG